jgi:tetratricopeptide (TPR) repeat protein
MKMDTPIYSNTPKSKRSPFRCLLLTLVLGIGALAFLTVLYFGVGFLLTRQIDARFAERDCVSLLQPAEFVERFYPVKTAPFTDPARAQAVECRVYLKADSLREKKDWKAAYKAYLDYQAAYPRGIYATEARDFAADSLFELASEQRHQQDFSGAVDNLALLLEKFSNTPAISRTRAALPDVYLEWGQECRAKEEFSEAESVYMSLTAWGEQEEEQAYIERAHLELTQTYFDWGKKLQGEMDFPLAASKFDKAIASDPDPDSANRIDARTELAQTYFDWGMDLEAKRDYSQAAEKFDKAISSDPDPDSVNGTAVNTRSHLPEFQRAWGEYLITQGKYPEAIQHYKTSVNLSSMKDTVSAKDALVQAYLKWAEALRKKDDYHQALARIDEAADSAASEISRKNAEAAQASTLDLFSKSNGSQAKKIVTDVTSSICKNGKPSDALPIIGILDVKKMTLSGITLSLPGNVLAQTPGNLHFVACAEEKEVTLQNCPYSRTGYGAITRWIKRIRYEWQIKIYNSQTGKLVNQKTFQGSAPQYCPQRYSFGLSSTIYFRGDKPTASTVTDWLASLLK